MRVRTLERSGAFKKIGRDRYSPPAVFAGVCDYFRRHDSSGLADARAKVLAARAREIELRNAQREGRLIEADDLAEHVAMIIGAFRSELAGVPAAATRDIAMRAAIEAPIENAITRLRDSFASGWGQWGEYACRLAQERLAALETSLADAPQPGDSVVETAYEAVKAARTKPTRRTTRKAMKR